MADQTLAKGELRKLLNEAAQNVFDKFAGLSETWKISKTADGGEFVLSSANKVEINENGCRTSIAGYGGTLDKAVLSYAEQVCVKGREVIVTSDNNEEHTPTYDSQQKAFVVAL